jgi:hypothetical protein
VNHGKPSRIVICHECAGLGVVNDDDGEQVECPVCEGELEVVVVTIPEYEYEDLFLQVVRMKVLLQEIIAKKYKTHEELIYRAKLTLRDDSVTGLES